MLRSGSSRVISSAYSGWSSSGRHGQTSECKSFLSRVAMRLVSCLRTWDCTQSVQNRFMKLSLIDFDFKFLKVLQYVRFLLVKYSVKRRWVEI